MAIGPGKTLGKRYRVVKSLDRGGMGEVWLGHDLVLERPVAIKVLLQEDPDPRLFERFAREARILAGLWQHQGITVVHDSGREGSQFFIVMELMEGSTLAAVLRSKPQGLPVSRAVHFAQQASEALGYAHDRGVVHRDVKPANMFVLHDDRLKIFDFGIAKKVNTDWTLTQPGVGMGTAAYMSPEQSISADMADKLSDLYSLGCAMYEMLTGLPPFGRGAEWTTLADMHRHAIPQPPRDLRPVPPALSDLVLRLLAKKPKERPQSASAVAAELKDISAGVTSDNRRPGEEAGFVSPPGDRSRKVPPRKVTAAELREMGPERAAVVLERLSSRRLAAEALNALASSEVAAILKLVSSGRAARYLGVVPPQHAAQVLEAMKRSRGAEILASFSSAEEAAALLGVMSPESAARLTATVNEKFLADVLVELNRPHNLEILDAMAISRRRSVVEHMTSADSQTLRQLAEKRLEEAESQIREMEELERQEKARHRLQDDRMPWTWAVRSSVCLLLVTTVAFDVGATAWKWESWPWLLLFIPVGLISVAGIYCAANAWFTGVAMATSGSALFLVAALFSALLVVQAVPKAAGMPVVVLAALSGAAVACWQMWAEDDHYSSVQQARRLGELAKHGSGGGSRGRSRGLFLALIRA